MGTLEQKQPIRVHTQCTYQQMKTFQNFYLRRPRWVSLLLLLAWIVGNIASKAKLGTWLVGSGFSVAVMTLLLIFTVIAFGGVFYTKKRHAEATHMMQNGFYYEFRENGFVARNNTSDFTGQREIAYESLYRVYDRGNMIYIYPKKKESLLIDTTRVSNDRGEELKTLLRARTKRGAYRRA